MDGPDKHGDWKKISDLGSGGFGTVMLWKNERTNQWCAIKKCKFMSNSLSFKQRQRWEQEVNFLKTIKHKNVIAFKELDPVFIKFLNKYNPSKLPLLTMEYCTKGNLRKYLYNEPLNFCGLKEYDLRYVMEDVCNGLKYLHSKQITHRDLKPENIVLRHSNSRKGQNEFVIIDLGYAKELDGGTLSFVGTLQYLAPEIFYNQNYTKSVDYWSMGLIAYELSCGVLPFLPDLTPFERFETIKNKTYEEICICQDYSGAISKSNYIKRENFLSSYFKQNMELWLRNVLQLEASKRVVMLKLDSFDYLLKLLDKQVLKVFSAYDFNFYSYEVGDMMVCTLKSSISRDTKLPEEDLLVLFTDMSCDTELNVIHASDDMALVKTLQKNEDYQAFVFKKGGMFEKRSHDLPKLLRELFQVSLTFNFKFAKALYRQALFFIYQENETTMHLKRSLLALIAHIENILSTLITKQSEAIQLFDSLLRQINIRNNRNNMRGVDMRGNKELIECLKYYERLLSNLERRDENLKKFTKEIHRMKLHIEESKKVVLGIFEKYSFYNMLQEINSRSFLEKEPGESTMILKRITNVVSAAIKLKFNLFDCKKDLPNCIGDIWKLLSLSERLRSWVNDFIASVEGLTEDFNVMENWYEQVIINQQQNQKVQNKSLSVIQGDSKNIIKENDSLRNQLEDVLTQFSVAQRRYLDDIV